MATDDCPLTYRGIQIWIEWSEIVAVMPTFDKDGSPRSHSYIHLRGVQEPFPCDQAPAVVIAWLNGDEEGGR